MNAYICKLQIHSSIKATQMIEPSKRDDLIHRQRLAKDYASKVRDIWFQPDKKMIRQLLEDFGKFQAALDK